MGMGVKERTEIVRSVTKEGLIEKVPLNRDLREVGECAMQTPAGSSFQTEGHRCATGQKARFTWVGPMQSALLVFSQANHTET